MFDSHVHLNENVIDKVKLKEKFNDINVQGAIILSLPPESFYTGKNNFTFQERLNNVLGWRDGKCLHPFFWIDPIVDDADRQVEIACEQGIAGFKVICDRFYPSDERAMRTFQSIASKDKPVLFHSGILWDGKVSSKYNRPIEFECLLDVHKLKFAMAHVSWPWCDELIAMYGKFLNAIAVNPQNSAEMYIDTTPGTPVIYREEVLRKLFTVGYDIQNNLIFGSDSCAEEYNSTWTKSWHSRDLKILKKLKLNDDAIEKYFSGNAKRFLGIDKSIAPRECPVPGV